MEVITYFYRCKGCILNCYLEIDGNDFPTGCSINMITGLNIYWTLTGQSQPYEVNYESK